MYHALRGKGFFLPWLTFHFWPRKRGFFIKGLFGEEKKMDFQVLLDVSLLRRRCESSQGRLVLRLGEVVACLPRQSLPRQRKAT